MCTILLRKPVNEINKLINFSKAWLCLCTRQSQERAGNAPNTEQDSNGQKGSGYYLVKHVEVCSGIACTVNRGGLPNFFHQTVEQTRLAVGTARGVSECGQLAAQLEVAQGRNDHLLCDAK